MPTKHPRINVTGDPELRDAIVRARPHMRGAGDATIVRALAIRGAAALEAEREAQAAAIDDLVAWSLGASIDRETLAAIDERAWRRG